MTAVTGACCAAGLGSAFQSMPALPSATSVFPSTAATASAFGCGALPPLGPLSPDPLYSGPLSFCPPVLAAAERRRDFFWGGSPDETTQQLAPDSPAIRVPDMIDPALHAGIEFAKTELACAPGIEASAETPTDMTLADW